MSYFVVLSPCSLVTFQVRDLMSKTMFLLLTCFLEKSGYYFLAIEPKGRRIMLVCSCVCVDHISLTQQQTAQVTDE